MIEKLFKVRKLARRLVVTWAEKIRGEESEARKKFEAEYKEAQDYVLQRIVGSACVHTSALAYCDRCPLGSFDGTLSHGAQRIICTRKRRYSK